MIILERERYSMRMDIDNMIDETIIYSTDTDSGWIGEQNDYTTSWT